MKGLAVAFLVVFGPGIARAQKVPGFEIPAATSSPRCITAGPDGARAQPPAVSLPRRTLRRGPAGAAPGGMAPSATGDFSIINVAVGLLPWDAAISPDERWAYILSAGSNEIDVVSLAPPRLSRRVLLDGFPTAMALSPDGGELYVGIVAIPPLTDIPADGCFRVVVSDPSSSILIMDTASMTVTGSVPVGYPALVNTLLPGPGAAQLVAVTDYALLRIDTRTHAAVSIPVSDEDHLQMESAAFASGGTKVFVAHVFQRLTIFDLATNTAHAAPPLPPGYTYAGPVAADPSGRRVFVDVCADFCGMAVLDAGSEETLKIFADTRVLGGALFGPDARVGYFPLFSQVIDLVTLELIGYLPTHGVSGAVSPGGSLVYVRGFGGYAGSVTFYGEPVHYDLAAIDSASLEYTGYTQLDSRDVICSWSSPLRVSASGRYLVAPNPTWNSVSVIKVDTKQERYPVDVSHPRPAPILVPYR